MDYFRYKSGKLYCEDILVDSITKKFGTPCYIYSVRTILEHYTKLGEAFSSMPTTICYSVKANSNLAILNLMKKQGAGFDVVSGGEIFRVLKIGAPANKIVFAGVGKTDEEIKLAITKGIMLFNVESEDELANINRIAKSMRKVAPVALRLNPDVDPHTHRYITTGKRENKFGMDMERSKKNLFAISELKNIRLVGLHIHIGSQITSVQPYVESTKRLVEFLPECEKVGAKIEYLNMGGGFGIWYKEKAARSAKEIADAILPILKPTGCKLLLEPGRFIVGNAGVLVSKVLYVKESGDKKFLICDAGMNDLIRPTLYGAYHKIWPTATLANYDGESPDEEKWQENSMVLTDVVGPICESGDFFAKDRRLPSMKRNEALAIFSAGAYGYTMASNYNSYPRPCEVLVSGKNTKLISRREKYADLIKAEVF